MTHAPRAPASQPAQQETQRETLQLVACGSSGSGKSSLIGRMLEEIHQQESETSPSRTTQKRAAKAPAASLPLAQLDSLATERQLGSTQAVAYRQANTRLRQLNFADVPGGKALTHELLTPASRAHAALLLVDAGSGIDAQTRHHACLLSLLGIRHVALLINKLELVDFSPAIHRAIHDEFRAFAAPLGFTSLSAIPLSALRGDNLCSRSGETPWYSGPTLLGWLETIEISAPPSGHTAFPVQSVCRQGDDFLGLAGTLVQGQLKVGDELRVTGSGKTARLAEIVSMDRPCDAATAGDALMLRLDRDVGATRGDVLALSDAPLEMTDQFEASLVWLGEEPGLIGRNYELKLVSQWVAASITNIKHRLETNTLAHEAARQLKRHDIAVCNLATTRPIVFDRFSISPTLGRFILVDRYTQATVAAGVIHHNLRRSQNVHRQSLAITRGEREQLNGHRGRVIWFTGLSGSGKSTLANALEIELHRRGMRTYILDGDNVRQGLNKDLGFTEGDRVENIRRIAEVAKLMMDAGLIVMTAFISPFRREREMARELVGEDNFLEIHVSTPLAVCEERDVKGLYRKARAGQIPNMTGINSPYETPDKPAYVADASDKAIGDIVNELIALLETPADAASKSA